MKHGSWGSKTSRIHHLDAMRGQQFLRELVIATKPLRVATEEHNNLIEAVNNPMSHFSYRYNETISIPDAIKIADKGFQDALERSCSREAFDTVRLLCRKKDLRMPKKIFHAPLYQSLNLELENLR